MKHLKPFLPLALVLLLVVVVEIVRPKPLDWTATYSNDDTIPFGSRVLHALLPSLFPGQPIDQTDATIYETLAGNDTITTGNYLFVSEYFTLDDYDTEQLLSFVEHGGSVLIAAERIRGVLGDSLGVETAYTFAMSDSTTTLRLSGPTFDRHDDMLIRRVYFTGYFDVFDTASTVVLGTDDNNRATYIRVPRGNGAFYLHSVPQAFTNYALLASSNSRYIAGALSYLPVQRTLWDEHYKPRRTEAQTPLRFVLGTPALQWAWLLSVASMLLFMVFEARRRQRVIPIVEPPANATLDFATMVGKLYFQHGDPANIAEKKITYFLDYLRTRLHVQTAVFDDQFFERTAGRSGVPEEEVRGIIDVIQQIRGKQQVHLPVDENDLHRLHERIDRFYRKSAR